MPIPEDLRRGDDVRKNWTAINKLSGIAREFQGRLRNAESALADLRLALERRGAGGGGAVKRYTIFNRFGDYLDCREYPSLFGPLVKVAKPSHLRVSVWNNTSIAGFLYQVPVTDNGDTREGTWETDGESKITESVWYPYGTDNEIYASELTTPIAIRTPATPPATGMVDGEAFWIDLNANARRWELGRTRFAVCKDTGGATVNLQAFIEGQLTHTDP